MPENLKEKNPAATEVPAGDRDGPGEERGTEELEKDIKGGGGDKMDLLSNEERPSSRKTNENMWTLV
jgi:hypothetical protein